MSFAALLPIFSMLSGQFASSASVTFDGIDPPASILSNEDRITCPDGLTVPLTPLRFSRIMSSLYSLSTARFEAFGQAVLENHQTYSTESRMRIRRTVTHSAGIGIFAGLYQKHSCAKWNPISSTNAISNLKW